MLKLKPTSVPIPMTMYVDVEPPPSHRVLCHKHFTTQMPCTFFNWAL